MAHFGESSLSYIMRKSGRKPSECACEKCKSQCHTPCLGTPEDILKLAKNGYASRLDVTLWAFGVIVGLIDEPIPMIQAKVENGWCTFYHDGKCELHDKGLKPTEGKLSHHSIRLDNWDPRRSISWLVAKEWLDMPEEIKAILIG